MNKEVIISIDKRHRWHVSCGNWQVRGYAESLEEAEYNAFKTVQGIPNHGTIHTIYEEGKPVVLATGSIANSFVKDNNEKE